MTSRETILRMAAKNGWTVHTEPGEGFTGVTEFRRRNGRAVAYLRVDCGVQDQVIYASWAPSLNGNGGRSIGSHTRNKLDRVLRVLREGS